MSFIPVNEPLLDGNELHYLKKCIDTGWISSEGEFVSQFEEEFAQSVDRKFGVAVSNGSAALDIAVKALGIGEGDEVILPTFTIISCAASIVRAGAKPVLVDADVNTWNMNLEQVENKITARTKAIMAVHIYGLPVEMNKLLDIARKNNLFIIEDAAEMHGQYYYDKPCGSFGDISTFSFYANKHITAGEGGMIVTNNAKLAERCSMLRNLCFQKERRFVHEELGWNYRFTNLQAAVGLAQLEKLNNHIEIKRKIGETYHKAFNDKTNFKLPIVETKYAANIFWVFGLVAQDKNAVFYMEALKKRNIGTRPFFYPMHWQPVFQKMGLFKNEKYPVSEMLSEYGFYLPSGLGLTAKQQQIVITNFLEILDESL